MIQQKCVEDVKGQINQSLCFDFCRVSRTHQVLNDLVNEDLKTLRHRLLSAKLSKHLQGCGRFCIDVAHVIISSFNLSVLFLVQRRAKHQNPTIRQDIILEHLSKGEQAFLKLDLRGFHVGVLSHLVCKSAQVDHFSNNLEVLVSLGLRLSSGKILLRSPIIHLVCHADTGVIILGGRTSLVLCKFDHSCRHAEGKE
jgi:hypothetical protein